MMKNILLSLAFISLSVGHVFAAAESPDQAPKAKKAPPAGVNKMGMKELNNLTQVKRLKNGISFEEAKAIMGDKQIIGYKASEKQPTAMEPAVLKNPYRSEDFSREEKKYRVLYYFTAIRKADGIVADDELTPVVFYKDRLVGKGWDYLFKLKNQ